MRSVPLDKVSGGLIYPKSYLELPAYMRVAAYIGLKQPQTRSISRYTGLKHTSELVEDHSVYGL